MTIKKPVLNKAKIVTAITGVALSLSCLSVNASIQGLETNQVNLTAKANYIATADGSSVYFWGFADNAGSTNGKPQYPAPTVIVNQGDTVTFTVKNELQVTSGMVPNVSIVFPGHEVTATCSTPGTDTCADGLLTMEAEPDGDVVSYTFIAENPGTYIYHSGTNEGLQVEMGLTGAFIVRSATAGQAYNHADTAYDREELFFLSEMDPLIHNEVEFNGVDSPQLPALLDNYFSNYWFINGRTAPDNFSADFAPWLPTQPYNSVPRMHPGEKVLMRIVGGGRDMHPFHHHGQHARILAIDGRMLESSPGVGPDLSYEVFTTSSVPGKTSDGIFTWTGAQLNWDIYGGSDVWYPMAHSCNGNATSTAQVVTAGTDPLDDQYFDPITKEYCPDHGKPFPVVLPEQQDLTFGGWWSGSPYLGMLGALPPGEGGLNPNGGFSFMWHSHTEKELANYDIFPGGMLTMMIIEAPSVPLD